MEIRTIPRHIQNAKLFPSPKLSPRCFDNELESSRARLFFLPSVFICFLVLSFLSFFFSFLFSPFLSPLVARNLFSRWPSYSRNSQGPRYRDRNFKKQETLGKLVYISFSTRRPFFLFGKFAVKPGQRVLNKMRKENA